MEQVSERVKRSVLQRGSDSVAAEGAVETQQAYRRKPVIKSACMTAAYSWTLL